MDKMQPAHSLKKSLLYMAVGELAFWLIYYFFVRSGGMFTGEGNQFMAFQHPTRLNLLWLIVLIAGAYIFTIYRNDLLYVKLGNKMRELVFRRPRTVFSFWKYFLFRCGFACLIIAYAMPAFGTKKVIGTVKTMETVICLDLSSSMDVKDVDDNLSRLGIAKRAINEMLNRMGGEKIGLVVFANDSYVMVPLTMDYYAVKMFVNDLSTSMMNTQGTNIKVALENAIGLFSDNKKMGKAIILITDGESHDGDPSSEIKQLKDKGIGLAILGIGTAKGGLIPVDPLSAQSGYKKNAMGALVTSKLDGKMLKELAAKADGEVSIASNAFPDIKALLAKLGKLTKVNNETKDFAVKEQRYQVPLILALFFFILYWIFVIYLNKR